MLKRIIVILLIGLLEWAYLSIRPPPPKICGSPGGPPITAPRIKLRDGRHLAFKEDGVPKETAKYNIIYVHGFGSCRYDDAIPPLGILKELGAYFVSFDRPGYGESDPDPNRNIKSMAFDIEELADQLGVGSKFYIIGSSMGGQAAWGCLKYIPHRLAGAALLAPVVNYWLPGFPENLSKEAYYQQFLKDQWALAVAHYIPWLTYWWNTREWLPSYSVAAGKPKLSQQDVELLSKLAWIQEHQEYITQQGESESIYRDMMVGLGSWEFDPMELTDPFLDNNGSVHLWQGDEDGIIPVILQRYIARKLSWIRYHELPGAGHLFPLADGMGEAILKTLLLGEEVNLTTTACPNIPSSPSF